MDKKPMVKKRNLVGNTISKSTTRTTNRDYEGMPYGRETVEKMKLVRDKEGRLVRGKKVTFQERSTGSRVLGSRQVERFSPKKGDVMSKKIKIGAKNRKPSSTIEQAKKEILRNPAKYDVEKVNKAIATNRGGKVKRVMRREMMKGRPF